MAFCPGKALNEMRACNSACATAVWGLRHWGQQMVAQQWRDARRFFSGAGSSGGPAAVGELSSLSDTELVAKVCLLGTSPRLKILAGV